jgi:hypothetical protein
MFKIKYNNRDRFRVFYTLKKIHGNVKMGEMR